MDVEEVVSVRLGKNGSTYVSFKSNGGIYQAVLGSSLSIEPHHQGIMNIVGETKVLSVPGFNGSPSRPQAFISLSQIVGWIDRGPIVTDFDNFFQSVPISTNNLSDSSIHRYTSSDASMPSPYIENSEVSSGSLKLKDQKK